MKNTIIAILVVIVLVLGGYLLLNIKPAQTPINNTPSVEETEDADIDNDDIVEPTSSDEMIQDDSTGDASTTDEDEGISIDGTVDVTIGNTKTVAVTGKNFEFSVKEIRVKKDDIVKVNFSSESGFHDWVIDEFNVRTKQLQKGQSDSVTFVANKAGTFEYYCSVGSHRQMGMVGKLIVE